MQTLFVSYAQISAPPARKNVKNMPGWVWNIAASAPKPAASARRNVFICQPLPKRQPEPSNRLRESHSRQQWFPQPFILDQHIKLTSHIDQQGPDKRKLLICAPLFHLSLFLHL